MAHSFIFYKPLKLSISLLLSGSGFYNQVLRSLLLSGYELKTLYPSLAFSAVVMIWSILSKEPFKETLKTHNSLYILYGIILTAQS